MRIVFAGTPPFAAVSLTKLLQCSYHVVSVLTQPDTVSGRGLKDTYSAVKQRALDSGIAVQQPATFKDASAVAALAGLAPDVLVVVAYGLILPPSVLAVPRLGCVNVHASLLPRWRGAAPIQRAIMAGDDRSGVCIMRMDAGLDTGPVYACRATPIGADETAGTLHDRLAQLGADALVAVLRDLDRGTAVASPQSVDGVTYAAKIVKADARIDWTCSATQIERLLRALDPVPGAYTVHGEHTLKIWRASVVAEGLRDGSPGTVLAAGPGGIEVVCGSGRLRVTELQRPGGRRLPVEAFLRGFRVRPGECFGDR